MKNSNIVRQSILWKFRLVIWFTVVLSYAIEQESFAQTAQIIYVKKGAAAPGDGASWSTAYPDLQQALASASTLPGNKEIWVARGEYKPTNTLDRNISFVMPANTILYGGFAGNETASSSRNWKINRTVLSGDLGGQFDNSDNSYHVVVAIGIDENSLLDGFVIKDGNSDSGVNQGEYYAGAGAGILIEGTTALTNPRINNCEFTNNKAFIGGAIFNFATNSNISSPLITNSSFVDNFAGLGSVIANLGTVENFPSFINCNFSSNRTNAGETVSNFSKISFVNCTFASNENKDTSPAPTIFSSGHLEVYNSILWKNFNGSFENPVYSPQIQMAASATSVVKNNIIQGGYGPPEDNNIDADPLFEIDPTFVGVYPRTSIIPVSTTDARYENILSFNGPKMAGPWPYYAYKDHAYNKLYMPGKNLQVIDFSNLSNSQPTSTVYSQVSFGRTQRLEQSIHTATNKIYFASYFSGIVSLDRATGQLTDHTPLAGEPITFDYAKARDLVVDDANGLLYSPIFYKPAGQEGNIFYGLLELNLTNNTKRWITTTSTPLAISIPVSTLDEGDYWGGYRIYLDATENTFYFSTGNGVWWWNRTNDNTGVISTSGGLTLAPGSPNLPSNLTTGMFMDHTDNKFYIGTHEGLFVWDRTNNTSRIYNTSNSSITHNLINHIDKNEEFHLIYVACEEGGVFVINTQTGEEKMITEDAGSEVHPQFMDNSAASVHYDEVDKKLYVSADHTSGGVWIQDYNNLIPDYGDLRLKAGSPAIDKGNGQFLPNTITTDIAGQNRFVNYASIEGDNSLDLGAHERVYVPADDIGGVPIQVSDVNYILTYTPVIELIEETDVENLPVANVNKNITYFDGLGRPIQSTAIQTSPAGNDITTPVIYDAFGRESKRYLPFISGNNGSYQALVDAQGNPNGIVEDFYDNTTDKVADDTRPFTEVIFEPSPLNRPDKEYGAGEAWAPTQSSEGKFIRHEYLSNVHSTTGSESTEAIIAWTVDDAGALGREAAVTAYIAEGGYYESNQLFIKVTLDEHGNAVREYTNKEGQVILKKVQAVAGSTNLNNVNEWACTYYVYDDLGNLRIVLPPEGVKQYLAAEN